jgi:DNA-binding NarL/FixJ family response regulator
MAVRAAVAGASAVVPKATAPRTLLTVLRSAAAGRARLALDGRALREAGEAMAPEDLPILGMLAHGVDHDEIAETLGIEPEWLLARRWAMLSPAKMAACPREMTSSRR